MKFIKLYILCIKEKKLLKKYIAKNGFNTDMQNEHNIYEFWK